jgi:hypothetical protein
VSVSASRGQKLAPRIGAPRNGIVSRATAAAASPHAKDRLTALWLRAAVIIGCTFALLWQSPVQAAGGKSKGAAVLKAKLGSPAGLVRSPSKRHVVRVVPRGLLLDGRLVLLGTIIGRPVWRRDGSAVACVRRAPGRRGLVKRGLQLVVLPLQKASPLLSAAMLSSLTAPLVWRVPRLVGRRPSVFWISKRSIGLGSRPLVPRVVISWTTQIARR